MTRAWICLRHHNGPPTLIQAAATSTCITTSRIFLSINPIRSCYFFLHRHLTQQPLPSLVNATIATWKRWKPKKIILSVFFLTIFLCTIFIAWNILNRSLDFERFQNFKYFCSVLWNDMGLQVGFLIFWIEDLITKLKIWKK